MTLEDVEELKKMPSVEILLHLPDNKNQTNIKVDQTYLDVLKAMKESKMNVKIGVFGKLHPEVRNVLGFDAEDVSRFLHNRAGNLEGMSKKRKDGKVICRNTGSLSNNNMLLPNGDVVLCCMDYGLEYILGNLLMESYEDLFNPTLGIPELCRYCKYGVNPNSIKYRIRIFLDKLIKIVYPIVQLFKKRIKKSF